jgi:DNA-binding transcriptional LysR family regulator
VTITDEGRRVYEQIAPLLASLEDVAASAAAGRSMVRGNLRISVHPVFSHFLLGSRLRAFLETYPELKLELVTRDRLGDLVGEGFDLAINLGDPRTSTLVARKLWETRILTVATPSYLKRHGRPEKPGDLAGGHVLIDFRNPENGRPFEWEFHQGKKVVKVPTGPNSRRTSSELPRPYLQKDSQMAHRCILTSKRAIG